MNEYGPIDCSNERVEATASRFQTVFGAFSLAVVAGLFAAVAASAGGLSALLFRLAVALGVAVGAYILVKSVQWWIEMEAERRVAQERQRLRPVLVRVAVRRRSRAL